MSNAGSDDLERWNIRVRETLARYSEPLLRQVTHKLLKPRNQWPVAELIDRSVASLTNVAVIDRRAKDLPESSRKLLAAVGLSRQPIWRVGELLSLLAVLNHVEGMTPILFLLEMGLAHPVVAETSPKLKQFEDWLGASGMTAARLLIHPAISERLINEDLSLPALPSRKMEPAALPIDDGLEWLIRLAVAWQLVGAGSVRLTQQGTLFKRDVQRFETDSLLASPLAAHPLQLPDAGLLALEWAVAADLLELVDGELLSHRDPDLWKQPLAGCLTSLWRALFRIEGWNPHEGYRPTENSNEYASVTLASFLLLRAVPAKEWLQAAAVADYLLERHPSWGAALRNRSDAAVHWLQALWIGVGTSLRVVEAAQDASGWWFRLGDMGHTLLRNQPSPRLEHEFRQTLVMQPNGELVVFRQGLTPGLIGKLTQFALWKTLGAACTMELTAESVYRGLETGLSLAEIQTLLEQHGTRSIPANVLDSLQRWSSKRERITVHTAATLLEFANAADLEAAFTRGLISAKLTDRIGLAAGGEEIDYRHYRLIGNRDYEARTQKCIAFDADGVTFTVDAAQSDLLLEAELSRLAEPLPESASGQRRYVLTPASLLRVRDQGWTIAELEQWAHDRSEAPLSSSARLLFSGGGQPGLFRRQLIVTLPSKAMADGIMQWTPTGVLVEERIGPKAIVVPETNLPLFIDRLREVGVEIHGEDISG